MWSCVMLSTSRKVQVLQVLTLDHVVLCHVVNTKEGPGPPGPGFGLCGPVSCVVKSKEGPGPPGPEFGPCGPASCCQVQGRSSSSRS